MRQLFSQKTIKILALAVLVGIVVTPFFFIESSGEVLRTSVERNYILGSVVYVLLLIASIVVAPLTSPLIYIAGGLLGLVPTALYNIFGWGVGSAIAFLLARHLGKPFLERKKLLHKVEVYEKRIPPSLTFWSIVFLRMVLPVDILSYVLGFVSSISFTKYMLATIIGITPFSIVFAYGGNALFSGKWFTAGAIALLLIIASVIGIRIAKKRL